MQVIRRLLSVLSPYANQNTISVRKFVTRRDYNFKCKSLCRAKSARSRGYCTFGVKRVTVSEDQSAVSIQWNDEHSPTKFHAVWLRWQCWCPQCRDQQSRQALYSNPGYNYTINDVAQDGDDLVVKFGGCESHVGRLPLSWLKKYNYDEHCLKAYRDATRPAPLEFPTPIEFQDFCSTSTGEDVLKLMVGIATDGLGMIHNAPLVDNLVVGIGEKLAGEHSAEPYGIDEIKLAGNDSEIVHLGNRAMELPPHMDFPYHVSQPQIIAMHCLKFDQCVEGGESVYVNVFHEAERFRIDNPDDFDILTKVPATFQRTMSTPNCPSQSITYSYHYPHITLNSAGDIIGVRWANETHGPVLADSHLIPAYYKAYSKFAAQIKGSPYKQICKLRPGDVVFINNRKVLHGRNGFKLHGGHRHFQTVELPIDGYRKKLGELALQLNARLPPMCLGDNDHNFRIIPN